LSDYAGIGTVRKKKTKRKQKENKKKTERNQKENKGSINMTFGFVMRVMAFFFAGILIGAGLNRWLLRLGLDAMRLVPLFNGMLYEMLYLNMGYSLETVLAGGVVSVLLILSIVDWKTMEIMPLFQIILLGYGLLHFFWKLSLWCDWILGSLIISVPLAFVFFVSRGKAVGGGDVKLMALCGFYVGASRIFFAFFVACFLSCLHQTVRWIRKKKTPEIRQAFAMGPYLSIGVFFSIIL
jgi:leader peptidase (prepilin peptidase)/N-methyltransferase